MLCCPLAPATTNWKLWADRTLNLRNAASKWYSESLPAFQHLCSLVAPCPNTCNKYIMRQQDEQLRCQCCQPAPSTRRPTNLMTNMGYKGKLNCRRWVHAVQRKYTIAHHKTTAARLLPDDRWPLLLGRSMPSLTIGIGGVHRGCTVQLGCQQVCRLLVGTDLSRKGCAPWNRFTACAMIPMTFILLGLNSA